MHNLGIQNIDFDDVPSDDATLKGEIRRMYVKRIEQLGGITLGYFMMNHGLQLISAPFDKERIPPESIDVIVEKFEER